MGEYTHYTVMKKEAVDILDCKDGLIYVDATLGGGGHSEEILKKIPNGQLFSFDIDDEAIAHASKKLKNYKNLTIIKNSYTHIKDELEKRGIKKITGGVLFDLGASYNQLTSATRGFSFSKEAKLDMRFNLNSDLTAFDIINTYQEDDLVRIFSEYGEEHFSKRIASKIIQTRNKNKIETTTQLANLIIEAIPKLKTKIHPATRVFQALRIEVNDELKNVNYTLKYLLDMLDMNAIISVISFHSIEDRIVKRLFKFESQKCRCNNLICTCKPPKIELVNKKPITASENELRENPPSRSAKLRAVRCIVGEE